MSFLYCWEDLNDPAQPLKDSHYYETQLNELTKLLTVTQEMKASDLMRTLEGMVEDFQTWYDYEDFQLIGTALGLTKARSMFYWLQWRSRRHSNGLYTPSASFATPGVTTMLPSIAMLGSDDVDLEMMDYNGYFA
jgi:hypothetical protein